MRGGITGTPGAWAGSVIVLVPDKGLYVTISQEKWDKVKKIVGCYKLAMMEGEKRKGGTWSNTSNLRETRAV